MIVAIGTSSAVEHRADKLASRLLWTERSVNAAGAFDEQVQKGRGTLVPVANEGREEGRVADVVF